MRIPKHIQKNFCNTRMWRWEDKTLAKNFVNDYDKICLEEGPSVAGKSLETFSEGEPSR